MASAYSLKYFETSAKENIGIKEFMLSLISDIVHERENIKNENNENIQIEKQKLKEENKTCGC